MSKIKKQSPDEKATWYEDGLRFKCTGCGKCCGGAPGYVWLTDSDITRLSTHLGISEGELLNKHCRRIGIKYSLKEKSITYDCVFLKDKKCSVYDGRPTQCRTYPFWGKNIETKRNWEETGRECEGVDPSGKNKEFTLIPLSTIRAKLQGNE